MATISLVGSKRALVLQLKPDIGKRYRIHNLPSSLNLKSTYLEQILVSVPSGVSEERDGSPYFPSTTHTLFLCARFSSPNSYSPQEGGW